MHFSVDKDQFFGALVSCYRAPNSSVELDASNSGVLFLRAGDPTTLVVSIKIPAQIKVSGSGTMILSNYPLLRKVLSAHSGTRLSVVGSAVEAKPRVQARGRGIQLVIPVRPLVTRARVSMLLDSSQDGAVTYELSENLNGVAPALSAFGWAKPELRGILSSWGVTYAKSSSRGLSLLQTDGITMTHRFFAGRPSDLSLSIRRTEPLVFAKETLAALASLLPPLHHRFPHLSSSVTVQNEGLRFRFKYRGMETVIDLPCLTPRPDIPESILSASAWAGETSPVGPLPREVMSRIPLDGLWFAADIIHQYRPGEDVMVTLPSGFGTQHPITIQPFGVQGRRSSITIPSSTYAGKIAHPLALQFDRTVMSHALDRFLKMTPKNANVFLAAQDSNSAMWLQSNCSRLIIMPKGIAGGHNVKTA